MLITQYILNLQIPREIYVGSGILSLVGAANYSYNITYDKYNLQFSTGEYVYDLNHNIWQITAIQGSIESPAFICTRLKITQSFQGSQLVKFTNENSIFNNIYDKSIDYYESILNKINNIPIDPNPPLIGSKYLYQFQIGEYVCDLNKNVWQIVTIHGAAKNPIYSAKKMGVVQDFSSKQLVKLTAITNKLNNAYDLKINSYELNLNKLNNLPVLPENENSVFLQKFNIGEYVHDIHHNTWQIISIQGATNNTFYTVKRLNIKVTFKETEIIRLTNKSAKDDNISKYEKMLDKLNSL